MQETPWTFPKSHQREHRRKPRGFRFYNFSIWICTLTINYMLVTLHKGWGQNAKLGPHSAIWGKLGTALQAYTLNPCTKFPPNPTSRKVNT